MTPSFRFEIGAATHTGHVRTRNEDAYLVEPKLGVFAVADGMGGHEAGDRASQAVVKALASVGYATSAPDLLSRVQDRLITAHESMKGIAEKSRAQLVGSTVVALLIHETFYACVWSGDSRLYRMRGRRFEQISTDHSEVQDLLDRGVLTPEEALTWAGRNAITRAVGVHEELEVEVLHGNVHAHDTFLLCSDGLTGHLRDDEIGSILMSGAAQKAAARLLHLALERGGEDNVTVVVVRCHEITSRENTVIRPRGS